MRLNDLDDRFDQIIRHNNLPFDFLAIPDEVSTTLCSTFSA